MNLTARAAVEATADTREKWEVIPGCCRNVNDSVSQAVGTRKGDDDPFLSPFMGYSNIAIRVAEVIGCVPLLEQLQSREFPAEGVTLEGVTDAFGCLETIGDIDDLGKIIELVEQCLRDPVTLVCLGGQQNLVGCGVRG